jgi:hypothetical protein
MARTARIIENVSALRDELLRLVDALPEEDLVELVAEVRSRTKLRTHGSLKAEGPAESVSAQTGVELRAVLDPISDLRQVPGVREVRYSAEDGPLDLWVLVDRDIDEATDRIGHLDYEFRRSRGSVIYGLHVVPLDSVAEQDLPLGRAV